jgi:hypothetical protein
MFLFLDLRISNFRTISQDHAVARKCNELSLLLPRLKVILKIWIL